MIVTEISQITKNVTVGNRSELVKKIAELARIHGYSQTVVSGLTKAAKLIIDGKVYENGEVESRGRVYHTDFDGEVAKYYCDCDGTAYDPILGKICEHALSNHLSWLLDLELPASPTSNVNVYTPPTTTNDLPPRLALTLEALKSASGNIVTHDDIGLSVYGQNWFDHGPTSNNIEKLISRLRKRIGYDRIGTARKQGWYWIQ